MRCLKRLNLLYPQRTSSLIYNTGSSGSGVGSFFGIIFSGVFTFTTSFTTYGYGGGGTFLGGSLGAFFSNKPKSIYSKVPSLFGIKYNLDYGFFVYSFFSSIICVIACSIGSST